MKNMKKININSIAQKCARKPDNFIIIHHLGVCKAKLHNVIEFLNSFNELYFLMLWSTKSHIFSPT